ncbi:hypothetical protein VTK56DRAFT_7414 [Thermocarpiscus australiensis]
MSFADRSLPTRGAGLPLNIQDTQMLDGKDGFALTSQPAAFDEPIFDEFCDMDSQDAMSPNPTRVRSNPDVPELPQRSALRPSRIFDKHGLKFGGAVEAAELGQATTPHDVYLSSEEDASTDADDFSDYDCDSSVEDPTSPTRRSRREDTARVVSVVFAGKPAIVDLPASRKRPISCSSMGTTTRTRSSSDSTASVKPPTTSSVVTEDRPVTPASTVSSQSQPRPRNDATSSRKGKHLSELLIKKKPQFLNIDPYANGSTYSLETPKAADDSAIKTPRTPTTLLKGVTRSLSLVRKRSRPALGAASTQAAPRVVTSSSLTTPVPPDSTRSLMQSSPATVVHVEQRHHQARDDEGEQQQQQQQQQQPPKTPQTPMTYNDVVKAVKKNAVLMEPPLPPTSDAAPPTSPAPAAATKRGILSGLAARRRSVKLAGRR